MKRDLIYFSIFHLWKYHSECDLHLLKPLVEGYNPDNIILVTCDGGLKHCDQRENICLATNRSQEDICKACKQERDLFANKMRKTLEKIGKKVKEVKIPANGLCPA